MFQDITLKNLFIEQKKMTHTLIDVRCPKEFQGSTIPGSINIPIFSDAEHAEVGTIYKQVGQKAAEKKGLEIFSRKLPDFIASFETLPKPMTVFCSRGGMRSKTAATVLDLMGIHANRLEGGIRAYRQWIVNELEKEDFSPDLYVLNGFTGTGKTILLKKLAQLGYPVIDLEGMAGHRGSIFGQIGMEPSKQKKFDTLLVTKMQHYQDQPFVFIEGESKRIGKVMLPDFLFEQKEKGLQIFIDLPIAVRVKNILEEYRPWQYPERFREAFKLISKRIHIPIAKEIEESLMSGDFANAVELLLTYYYDPRYKYSINHYDEDKKLIISASDMEDALEKITTVLQQELRV